MVTLLKVSWPRLDRLWARARVLLAVIAIAAAAQVNAQSLLFQQQEKPWSFFHFGDLHAGVYLREDTISNDVQVLARSNAAWNLKCVLQVGDLYEPATNAGSLFYSATPPQCSVVAFTNYLWRFKTNGIPVFLAMGNHEVAWENVRLLGGQWGAYLDAYTNCIGWEDMIPLSFYTNGAYPDPFYLTNRTGNTLDVAWKLDVGSSRFLFIGLAWRGDCCMFGYCPTGPAGTWGLTNVEPAYHDSIAWASNLCAQYHDRHVVIFTHYFLNLAALPGTSNNTNNSGQYYNIGPGAYLWQMAKTMPNVDLILCGHVLQSDLNVALLPRTDGWPLTAVKVSHMMMHNQLSSIGGAGFLFTVYPTANRIHAQVFAPSGWGPGWTNFLPRFVTNYEYGSDILGNPTPCDFWVDLKSLK